MSNHEIEVHELIDKVKIELKNAQYSDSRIEVYIPVWDHLTFFMLKKCKSSFTAKIGLDFLESEYGITVFKHLSSKNSQCVRAVNLLSDYLLHGMIFSRTKQAVRTYHPQFQTVFQGYINEKRTDGASTDTLKSYELYLGRFSDYLNNHGIANIHALNETMVLGFANTFIRHSPSIIHNTLCALRTFFHYLFENGFVAKDYAYIVPHDGYRQRTKVPSAYTKEDVDKLIKSIDRGNAKGKRDYAIILIAARLGLRAQDICNLSFNNLRWEINTIELLQEKTEKPIILPLLEDVGLAIIDYLKYARPDCKLTDAIFLRLIPPIRKLEAPTLHSIVTHHMRTAGIKVEDGKKHGPHALRHSLASALLEQNTPLPIISEILGHTSTETTSIYLKLDINQLRSCSLEPPKFDWNQIEEEAF